MNRANVLFCGLGMLLFAARSGSADELVAFPTGDASWTVNISPKDGGQAVDSGMAPANRVVEADIEQLRGVKRTDLKLASGQTLERWSLASLPITFEDNPQNDVVFPAPNEGKGERTEQFWVTYDRFAFDWITPSTLQEKDPVTYQGVSCYHYRGQAVLPLPKGSVTATREAWIDAETHYPVAFDNGVSLSTYTFPKKPPTGPLQMPPKFKRAIAYYKAAMGIQ